MKALQWPKECIPTDGQNEDDLCHLSTGQVELIAPQTTKFRTTIDKYVKFLSQALNHDEIKSSTNLTEVAVAAQKARIRELCDYLKFHAVEYAMKRISLEFESGEIIETASDVLRGDMKRITLLLWLLGKLFVPVETNNLDKEREKMDAQFDRVNVVTNKLAKWIPEANRAHFLAQKTENIEILRQALWGQNSVGRPHTLTGLVSRAKEALRWRHTLAERVNGLIHVVNAKLSNVRK